MPFHVEISSGFGQLARAFNLDEPTMRATVLDPWMRGRTIKLGDKDWEPRDSSLIILEGPDLADADLAMGRGWSSAERRSENVTRRLVEDEAALRAVPHVAVLAGDPASEAEVAAVLERLELPGAPWSQLRARILEPLPSSSGMSYAAVLVTGGAPAAAGWLFDAGLARGALGRRAVFCQLGDGEIPAELAGIDVLRLDPRDQASLRALWERLTK